MSKQSKDVATYYIYFVTLCHYSQGNQNSDDNFRCSKIMKFDRKQTDKVQIQETNGKNNLVYLFITENKYFS